MTRPCWNACPACGGEGQTVTETGIDRTTGAVMERFEPCDMCAGKGEIEQPVEPVTLEDLELRAQAEARKTRRAALIDKLDLLMGVFANEEDVP